MTQTEGERLAVIEERQSDYDRWNVRQNGRLDRIDGKLDSSKNWLIGLMGSMVVSMALLVVNICIH